MTIIKKYVEAIEDEVCGAKEYAEKAIEAKARGDMPMSIRYKEMSNDELKHAMYIHEMATREVAKISEVYTPPVEMLEKWENAHKKYVEEVALIRQMLEM
jgi:predicted RNA-binding protein with RPS1 domain